MFEEKDWKDYLDDESKAVLAELFDKSKKSQGAYLQADNVKIAQLWTAMVELKKELDKTRETVDILKKPFESIIAIGEAEKRRAIERLVRDIVKPEPEHEESTQKLIDSLMKF